MSVKEISKKWTMPVRDWGLAYSQLAIFFEDSFAAWRLMRVLPKPWNKAILPWGLSALGISGEDEEKQQHFCHCSSPFYSAACAGTLLRTQLAEFLPMFGCIFSIVRILAIIAFTRFDFQNPWFQGSRRLSKDYEIKAVHAETMCIISHIHTLLRRFWSYVDRFSHAFF